MASLIGQRLGQYEILALLGKGGMGTVYAARQLSIDRHVAIKVIRDELADSDDFIRRFEREVQISAKLSHPHILKVFDFGRSGQTVFLVMELISRGSLADLIKTGPLLTDLTLRITDQMASALDYAHQLNIVHRDLKPQNVLIDQQGNAALTDFGVARILQQTTLTHPTGVTVGTPAYIAPEVWQGIPSTGSADIYALGIMVFEMLAGYPPFNGDSLAEVMYRHLEEVPPSIHAIRAEVPAEVDQVLLRTLAKDPKARFRTAREVSEALKNAFAGVISFAPVVTDEPHGIADSYVLVDPLNPGKGRRSLVYGAAASTLILLLGLGIFGIMDGPEIIGAKGATSTRPIMPTSTPTPTNTVTSTVTPPITNTLQATSTLPSDWTPILTIGSLRQLFSPTATPIRKRLEATPTLVPRIRPTATRYTLGLPTSTPISEIVKTDPPPTNPPPTNPPPTGRSTHPPPTHRATRPPSTNPPPTNPPPTDPPPTNPPPTAEQNGGGGSGGGGGGSGGGGGKGHK